MSESGKSSTPGELARSANLLAHPMAGVAAASALGLGLASQAFGLWMGAVMGFNDNARRMFEPESSPDPSSGGQAEAFRPAASPEMRARAAARTVIADAEAVARAAGETVARSMRDVPVAPGLDAKHEAGPRQPAAIARPRKPDDLKTISGIGPKLEKVLNDLGIWTFAQIAAWSGAEAAWLDERLSLRGRVARDTWIEQASGLAKRAAKG